jgi:hypothetical protein
VDLMGNDSILPNLFYKRTREIKNILPSPRVIA